MSALAQRRPGGALLMLACLPASFAAMAWARTNRIEPIGSYVSRITPEVVAPVVDVRAMVATLRDGGLPVAAIAEMARVERKTVYAWLDGGEARPERESRLVALHGLLTGAGLDLRGLWRVASRPLASGATLRQLLGAETLDATAVTAALRALEPAVARQTRSETARLPASVSARNAVLDDVPVADLG